MRRFASLLDQLAFPIKRSLSIGCGSYPEFASLYECHPRALHIGLDRDMFALKGNAGFQPFLDQQPALIQANGLRLPFACKFDLILIRHPDVAKLSESWTTILQQIPFYLEKVLLITTYSLDEYEFVRHRVTLPAYPLNENALTPVDLVGHDKFVLAYQVSP